MALQEEVEILQRYLPAAWHMRHPAALQRAFQDWLSMFLKTGLSSGFPGGATVKNVPADIGVQRLSWEDPLEWKMATRSSILTWKISWTEEPGGLQSMGSQRSDTTKHACAVVDPRFPRLSSRVPHFYWHYFVKDRVITWLVYSRASLSLFFF